MNDKQQRVFDNLVLHEYGDMPFNSAAQDLEEHLHILGITPPVKLYYQYRLPENQTPQQFEKILQRLMFICNFEPQEILNTSEYYQELAQCIPEKNIKYCFEQMRKTCEKDCAELTDDEKKDFVQHVLELQELACMDICTVAQIIQESNPELKSVRVNMDDVNLVIAFVEGVVYGYAPDDIDYFLNTDIKTRSIEKDKWYAKFESLGVGIYLNYILRPDREQKILDAVIQAHGSAPKETEA